ncbi:hypothetical protein HPT28_05415 [Streptomyces sp. JJ38]|nr:hypothetical protein [Streptomyces sp. JJ38]
MTTDGTGAVDEIELAEQVCGELATALRKAGIVLPPLGLDVASCAGEPPSPLVELGRCRPETARALVAVVRAGAHR